MAFLQGIENAVRGGLLGVAARFAGAVGTRPLPDWTKRPYRVLFLRDDGIGDMIVSLEIMRAIAESSPTLRLDVLASPQNASLVEGQPWIGEVIVHRRGSSLRSWPLRRALRQRGYDAVIDGRVAVQSVNTQTTLILLATRAPWRIGIAGRRNDSIYSVPITPASSAHYVDHLVALASPFGVSPRSRDWRPKLTLTDAQRSAADLRWQSSAPSSHGREDRRLRVLLNISAGNPDRRWPDDRYAAVLARLRELMPSAQIAVLAMPNDRSSSEHLARGVSGTAISLSVPDTIGAVATADMVITPDTAISHMASAFSRPTLTLLRKGFERWVPYKTPGRNVFGDDPRSLLGLPADRVVRALEKMITEHQLAARPSASH